MMTCFQGGCEDGDLVAFLVVVVLVVFLVAPFFVVAFLLPEPFDAGVGRETDDA